LANGRRGRFHAKRKIKMIKWKEEGAQRGRTSFCRQDGLNSSKGPSCQKWEAKGGPDIKKRERKNVSWGVRSGSSAGGFSLHGIKKGKKSDTVT